MKWLFRPATLLVVSVALAVVAGWLMFQSQGGDTRPQPRPVDGDDQEIAWLYAATSASAWERFVTGLKTAADRLRHEEQLDLTLDEQAAFPVQTTAVPELTLSVGGATGRLHFRWYKLTSDWKVRDWVQALAARPRPPLAIIGGNSSDLAIDITRQLREVAPKLGNSAPLLFVTNATTVLLENSYDDAQDASKQRLFRFRFCFDNQRMADAVTDFIWSRDDLRPENYPVYGTKWDDDPYSDDLNLRFKDALLRQSILVELKDYKYFTVNSSVGTFDRPNRGDAQAVDFLFDDLAHRPFMRQPMLVLTGQTQPCRRFLRAVVRKSPVESRRFTIATGDALSFNTIYRDRNVAWHIQDLPFRLVLFCHRNPVEAAAGFAAVGEPAPEGTDAVARSSSGTEDLLLYKDMVEALVQAAYPDASSPRQLLPNAEQLGRRLQQAVLRNSRLYFDGDGQRLFTAEGNRNVGTGEHVVCLQPVFEQDSSVRAKATIEVLYWDAKDGGRWLPRREPLAVPYDGLPFLEVDRP